MEIGDNARANKGSVANATLTIVKHGSERYGPVSAQSSNRTTLYSTPPKKGTADRRFAGGEDFRGTHQIAQVFDIGTVDADRDRLADEREKWRQVSFAWAQKLMEVLAKKLRSTDTGCRWLGKKQFFSNNVKQKTRCMH